MPSTHDNSMLTARLIFSLGYSASRGTIERQLKSLAGIESVRANYVTDTILVDYDPSQLTIEQIRAFLIKLGYNAAQRR